MPSIRLLSLVHEGLKTRLKWIPWQYRLSQKQYQEILEAKTTKAVRSEVQLLTAAFMDDQPELSVESRPLSAGWLMQIQTIFRNALALCNAAHLKSLKDFDKKIADLCLKQPDRTSGLRTVTTQELLSADRRMWNTISDLLREGWSLDEALHEMTTVRSDIPSLLQWRPAQPRLPPALEQLFKGKGKGKGKLQLLLDEPPWKKLRTDDKPFKKTEKPQPTNLPKNWADKFQGKPICRRYQSGTCKTPGCKFAHVCAIRVATKATPPGSTKTNRLIRLDSQGPGQAAWASHPLRLSAQSQPPTLRPLHPHQTWPLAPTPPFPVTRKHLGRPSLSLRHLSHLQSRGRRLSGGYLRLPAFS